MSRSAIFTLVFAVLFSGAAIAQDATPTPEPAKKANQRPAETTAAEPYDKATVSEMAGKCVELDTESGLIKIELYPEQAPETVRSFLNLTATGMLDTTTFSRVVPGFVIQGGDLYTRSEKVPYAVGMRARKIIPDEPNKILHTEGIVSMARGDEPNTASTHFFILLREASSLDGKFAAFGKVIAGLDVVKAINAEKVSEEKPDKPIRIKKASVVACAAN